MKTKINETTAYVVAVVLSGGFFAWWAYNYLALEAGDRSLELYSDTYWVVALVGAVYGLLVAKQWGGLKSVFGRALILFSLGLFAQVFGQVVYSYYALVQGVEAPYPSIGDIGYFGSVLLYIAALFVLFRAIGARFRSANFLQKAIAVIAPFALLTMSYKVFLNGYERCYEDEELLETVCASPIQTLLDFGYPLGQAFYVAVALLAFILSFKLLGGIMKNKILLLLFALLIQYLADFTFLYRFSREEYYAGGPTDLIYQTAYLLMTIALLRIGSVARSLTLKKDD